MEEEKKAKLEKELKEIDESIDKIVNNLVYLLTHVDIDDINLLNIHFNLEELRNRKNLIKNELFIDDIYD